MHFSSLETQQRTRTNSYQSFKSLNSTDYQWISSTAEVTQKEILTSGKPRRCVLQIAIKARLEALHLQ